jgi:hypothetical protein
MNELEILAVVKNILAGGAILAIVAALVAIFFVKLHEEVEEVEIDAIDDPVIREQLRRIEELEDKLEKARTVSMSRTAVAISQEKGQIIREQALELDNIRMSLEKIKGWANSLRELEEYFKKLQDLAIWMTGCGYNFMQHPYYRDNKYLFIKGITEDSEKKFYTRGEAKKELLREVPCPCCESLTILGLMKDPDSDGFIVVEGRYCPVCNWKAIPLDEEVEKVAGITV